MEAAADSFFVAKILLSVTTFMFAFVPSLADLNKTHATNPLWTPHARYHVVWQCVSYLGLGALSLYLIWFHGGDQRQALQLVMLFALFVFGSFFVAYFTMKFYGGSNFDENGYPPVKVEVAGFQLSVDGNLVVFSIGLALLFASYWMVG